MYLTHIITDQMKAELYRFLFERNRNNSTKSNSFALQSLRIKSSQEREQNKGVTKEVLI